MRERYRDIFRAGCAAVFLAGLGLAYAQEASAQGPEEPKCVFPAPGKGLDYLRRTLEISPSVTDEELVELWELEIDLRTGYPIVRIGEEYCSSPSTATEAATATPKPTSTATAIPSPTPLPLPIAVETPMATSQEILTETIPLQTTQERGTFPGPLEFELKKDTPVQLLITYHNDRAPHPETPEGKKREVITLDGQAFRQYFAQGLSYQVLRLRRASFGGIRKLVYRNRWFFEVPLTADAVLAGLRVLSDQTASIDKSGIKTHLPGSAGNKAEIILGNTEDVRRAVYPPADSAEYPKLAILVNIGAETENKVAQFLSQAVKKAEERYRDKKAVAEELFIEVNENGNPAWMIRLRLADGSEIIEPAYQPVESLVEEEERGGINFPRGGILCGLGATALVGGGMLGRALGSKRRRRKQRRRGIGLSQRAKPISAEKRRRRASPDVIELGTFPVDGAKVTARQTGLDTGVYVAGGDDGGTVVFGNDYDIDPGNPEQVKEAVEREWRDHTVEILRGRYGK